MFKKYFLTVSTFTLAVTTFNPTPAVASDDFDHWLSKERFQIRGRVIGVLADGDGTVEGTSLGTDVGDALTPEVDFTYFFTKNIAAEAVVATAQHEVSAGSNDLGETFILPPTVVLQYHFQPDEKISPYVGVGVNYSVFYGEEDGTGFDDLEVEGGFGIALQAGVDYWINDNWGLNLDAKYIDLDIDAKVTSGSTRLRTNDVELNPWIIGAGVSYRF